MPRRKYPEPFQYPKCPHCGGEHWGQRFDACPFVAIATDANATESQRTNAAATLESHRAKPPVVQAGREDGGR